MQCWLLDIWVHIMIMIFQATLLDLDSDGINLLTERIVTWV